MLSGEPYRQISELSGQPRTHARPTRASAHGGLLGRGFLAHPTLRPLRKIAAIATVWHSAAGVDGASRPGAIRAIGVDEIQRGKGHKYLTLVYQIDLGCTRLLWIGKERTVKTFQEFFAMIGPEVSAKIEFVCSTCGNRIGSDPREVFPGVEYPRPVPHRGQGEQGARRHPLRRSQAHEGRLVRTGPDQVPVVPS